MHDKVKNYRAHLQKTVQRQKLEDRDFLKFIHDLVDTTHNLLYLKIDSTSIFELKNYSESCKSFLERLKVLSPEHYVDIALRIDSTVPNDACNQLEEDFKKLKQPTQKSLKDNYDSSFSRYVKSAWQQGTLTPKSEIVFYDEVKKAAIEFKQEQKSTFTP